MKKLNVEYDLVYIIDCLSEPERNKHQDSQKLMHFLAENGINQQAAYCDNKKSILYVLNLCKNSAKSGKKFPIVFISHGNSGFLSIKHTTEEIIWQEFRPIFNELNNLMDGDLIVIMACCFGFNGYKIDQRDSSKDSFFGIIGPIRKITPEESITANEVFFKNLIINADVPNAVREINSEFNEEVYKCLALQDNKLI